jgi:DNA topoisomerase-1
MISAGIGRYGPYVLHEKIYANLPTADEVFEVGLNRAVAVLAEKRAGGRGGRTAATALAELGPHPADGEPVRVLSGRFGPYIKHGAVNANVPRGADPTEVTMEEAVKVLAERVANGGGGGKTKGRRGAKPAARKPAAAKAAKAPAKKAAAKKPAPKTARKAK